MKKLFTIALCIFAALLDTAMAQKTVVTIQKDQFFINGSPTYAGRYWQGNKIEGLLMNTRMANGIFDDLNEETRCKFNYPDTGEWSADRNTKEFIEAMSDWYAHGVISFDLNLQGGSPVGYGNPGHLNSAFEKNGKLREDYKSRLKLVLDEADELGMIVMLGYFYFGADQYLEDEKAVIRATTEATNFILDNGYKNVIVEIANECDIYYDHEILKPARIHELINLVKSLDKSEQRILVSTSCSGTVIPTENIMSASDLILLHANGVKSTKAMREFLQNVRKSPAYTLKPVVVNEDDHYDFDKKESNLSVSVEEYVSWGFFDYRRKGEAFEDGYQSIPASWGITSERKRAFFDAVKEITAFGEEYDEYFSNPILSGYHPDPSICRVGEDYYMVNSSFEWFPAIPIYHSRDLVNWELINYGVMKPEDLELAEGLRSSGGIYAVTIRHHDGVFYIITTNIGGGGNFYITAENPRDEWSAPHYLNCPGIDPSLMWDDDGKCYYVGNGRLKETQDWKNQQGVWVQELDLEKGELVGERVQISFGQACNATWAEGPHIYKINGKYLLLLSEGGTEFAHAVTQFYSDNIFGPYTAHQINPVLTHRDMGRNAAIIATGHADIVETQNGEWWMVALATRYSNGHNYLARETFLTPMIFEKYLDEEGIIVNPGKGKIQEVDLRPNLPWSPICKLPARDEFNSDKLRLEWNMLRTPHSTWWKISKGQLILDVREGTPNQCTNASLLAKRIDDTHFTAETLLDFSSKKSNEEVGLILYRNDQSTISLVKSGSKILGVTYIDGERKIVAEMDAPKGKKVALRMVSDGKDVKMYAGENEFSLKEMDGTAPLWIISTRGPGQFNGTMVGMYATSNGKKSRTKAAFDYFDYK